MKRSELIFTVILVPLDFAMLLLAGVATYLFRTHILDAFRPVQFEINLPMDKYFLIVLVTAVLFIAAYAASGLYAIRRHGLLEEFLRILVGSSAAVLGVIIFIFLRQELFNSRFLVIGGWLIAILFVMLGRIIVRQVKKYLVSRHNVGVHKVMVIGEDSISDSILREIETNPASGYRIIKRLANPEVEEIKASIGNPGVDEVILANPNYPADKVVQLIDFCHENHLVFRFVPNIYQTLTTNYSFDTFMNVPLVELRRTALDGWGKVWKRGMDILGAITGLILTSPFYLILSLWIKLDSEGPIFVRLKRVSQGRQFNLLKFRSMIKEAEEMKPALMEKNERKDGPLFKMKNDPRVTRAGRFIRRYRIDEIPQFINVLKGDIGLVGPRPHQPDEIAKYEKRHKKVLNIKSGVTGMAQISGSSDLPFEQEVSLDTFYIENWSLWLDVKILLKTVVKVFFDRSAV